MRTCSTDGARYAPGLKAKARRLEGGKNDAKTTTVNTSKSNTFRAGGDKVTPSPTPKAKASTMKADLTRDTPAPNP